MKVAETECLWGADGEWSSAARSSRFGSWGFCKRLDPQHHLKHMKHLCVCQRPTHTSWNTHTQGLGEPKQSRVPGVQFRLTGNSLGSALPRRLGLCLSRSLPGTARSCWREMPADNYTQVDSVRGRRARACEPQCVFVFAQSCLFPGDAALPLSPFIHIRKLLCTVGQMGNMCSIQRCFPFTTPCFVVALSRLVNSIFSCNVF